MIIEPLLMLLPLAAGFGAAQLTGPTACDWRAAPGQMKARLLALKRRPAVGPAARLAGSLTIAFLFSSAALIAYAAQPSAPQQLPGEVVGVTGSGDQISLQVKATGSAAERTIRIGEEYKDGWTLQALTPAVATLAKDGQSQAVGLNPAGALASAEPGGPKSTVTVTGPLAQADDLAAAAAPAPTASRLIIGSQAADVVAERLGQWNGKARPGLTVDETKRLITLGAQATQTLRDQGLAAGKTMSQANMASTNYASQVSALGADGADFDDLDTRARVALYNQELDAYNRYGPISITLPAGGDFQAAMEAANAPGAAWTSGPGNFPPTTTGPTTWTIVKPNPSMLQSMLR